MGTLRLVPLSRIDGGFFTPKSLIQRNKVIALKILSIFPGLDYNVVTFTRATQIYDGDLPSRLHYRCLAAKSANPP
jgi:hypothetical protein